MKLINGGKQRKSLKKRYGTSYSYAAYIAHLLLNGIEG